jgi:hypothetical protein
VKTATDRSSRGRATGPQAFHNIRKEAMAKANFVEVMKRLLGPPVLPSLDRSWGKPSPKSLRDVDQRHQNRHLDQGADDTG